MQRRVVLAALAGVGLGALVAGPGIDAAQRISYAVNAGTVNGIGASRTPKANTLLPLDNKGQVDPKVLPVATVLGPGRTVTGAVGGTFTATAANQAFSAAASIFPAAPRPIAPAQAGIDESTAENPVCTGSLAAPTAPPGFLCVYLNTDQAVNVAQDCSPGPFPHCATGQAVLRVGYDPIYSAQHGFAVRWTSAAAGTTTVYGVWAYTAPIESPSG
jgi:hypothetical protein